MKKKGLTFLKRLISFCLILCLSLGFSACSQDMSPVENALIAVKNMDVNAFASCMTSDSEASLSRIVTSFETGLAEEEKETMKNLYSLIRYTMGEEVALSEDTKTITVSVKIPDMARVRTLTEKKILVSAETANEVVSDMLESGEIAGYYMLDATWQIMMKKEDGKWKLSYADKANETFVSALYLAEMTAFFAQN